MRRTLARAATTAASTLLKDNKISVSWLDLRGSGLSVLERLLLEECLLRHDDDMRNWMIVGQHEATQNRVLSTKTPEYVRQAQDPNPSAVIVMGIGGKPDQLLNLDLVKYDGVTVLKRFSGGGTVVLDYDSIWTTFIGRSKDFMHVEAYPRPIMQWSAETVFGPLFCKLGTIHDERDSSSLNQKQTLVMDTKSCAVENTNRVITIPYKVVMVDDPSTSRPLSKSPPPLFRLVENDYVLGERKMGGNAQSIVKTGWLHHTSFLWKYQPEHMEYLTLPSKRPDYREDRTHDDFLVQLQDSYPALQKIDFFKTLQQVCEQRFDLQTTTMREAMAVVDEQGGLQEWFENGSRTRVLHQLD